MAGYVPRRYSAQAVTVYMSPVVHSGVTPTEAFPLLGATALKAASKVYGPARNIVIEDDVETIDRTGSGDPAPFDLPVRRGRWKVEIAALIDCRPDGFTPETFVVGNPSGVTGTLPMDSAVGDNRWQTLIGGVVELLICIGSFNICYCVGLFRGRMLIPAESAESVVRDSAITRVYPNKRGHILWANLQTGVFDSFDPDDLGALYPPPFLR